MVHKKKSDYVDALTKYYAKHPKALKADLKALGLK
jgi:hypothetical protein